MIKKILWVLGAVAIISAAFVTFRIAANRRLSPAAEVLFQKGDMTISVDYSRPYKKNRLIFGGLVPFDAYWRTGANDPTIIEFSQDFQFGNAEVKAGTYRFYTIPGPDQWTVVLNSELEKWGIYEPDYNLDIARAMALTSNTSNFVEQFLIEINPSEDGAIISLSWDDTEVVIPIIF